MRNNWFIAAAAAAIAACSGGNGSGSDPVTPPEIALEAKGVVGAVSDASAARVAGGTVYFVPAAQVAALPATSIAGKTGPQVAGATDDEPLEDLIAASGATYPKAEVGSNGVYRLATLPEGSYFVTFVPAEGAALLPGGSECRKAKGSAELVGKRLDLTVSAATPASATFVGTGRCAGCHGELLRSHKATMHRVGIWSPYESGPMQDLSARQAELYDAFTKKFEANEGAGTTIYFHSYDTTGTRSMDKYKTSETDPGSGVDFTARVFKDGDKYKVELKNVKTPGDGDATYTIDAVYGGGVKKQRYMTKMTAPDGGFFYAILPMQYQPDGDETYGRTSTVWRDYHGGTKWFDNATGKFRTYAVKDSFEKNCISCHATGAVVTGTNETNWNAAVIRDAYWGDWRYGGDDATPAEMNLGCENCHGPGSAHVAVGAAKFIVTPSLLTPEREALLCGQCHSRPKGALNTDSPVNAAGEMIVAGTSRQAFLAQYATSQADGAASDYYADEDGHSKSHHQQYSDFIRSGMYKNASELMTCSSCHDPHARPNHRQLRASPTDNAALCGSCHAAQGTNLGGHLLAQGIPYASAKAAFARCTDCHMPKVAKTGAGEPGIKVGTTQYWTNDVSSHLFAVPRRGLATTQSMPVPYTNACGTCHTTAP